jgi:glycerol uptake facilitator protein
MESFSIAKRSAAEAIGTALLVFVGVGSVPAIMLLEGGSGAPFSGADLGFIAVAFGLILVAMIYAIGKVSGCHINPAVTFGLAVSGRFPWREVPLYWGAQLIGGIAGAFAMWASFGTRAVDLGYGFGVVHFDRSTTAWGSAMFVEALGTAILLFTILGIVDLRSPQDFAGLVIGLVLVALIITVGPITNASFNPARAIGPLFVTSINGGVHNWTQQFLAYIPANLIGAAAAVLAYDWISSARKIEQPIEEAVTEADRA